MFKPLGLEVRIHQIGVGHTEAHVDLDLCQHTVEVLTAVDEAEHLKVGQGGEGAVVVHEEVDVVEGGESLPSKYEYAIKFLTVNSEDENEVEKRRSRFEKEIREVLSFQDNVNGIIPIYDSSVFCEGQQEIMWYLMPKAERYNPKNISVLQKLTTCTAK